MIDWNKTEIESKFDKEYFKIFPNSKKEVYKVCDMCGRAGWMSYQNNPKLCAYCGGTIRKVKEDKGKKHKVFKSYNNPNLTPRINEYTYNTFGYYPHNLTKNSQSRIMRICSNCGKIENIQYKSYNRQKYPNLCRSCSIKVGSRIEFY